MPQLDIIYMFMTYAWSWFILYRIMQQIKTYTINTLPWT